MLIELEYSWFFTKPILVGLNKELLTGIALICYWGVFAHFIITI